METKKLSAEQILVAKMQALRIAKETILQEYVESSHKFELGDIISDQNCSIRIDCISCSTPEGSDFRVPNIWYGGYEIKEGSDELSSRRIIFELQAKKPIKRNY